ncbi:MAG: hypothetical protein WBP11_01310 [Dokdonella sp.]
MPRFSMVPCVIVSLFAVASATAEVPQMLTATVGDAKFASDDGNIYLIPVPGSFTLTAATAGADAYPPPKTPIDRLSITCNAYADGKPTTYAAKEWGPNLCQVNFIKGDKPMGGEPDATYTIDKSASDNLLEITSANGKVIEGRFHFTLKSEKGATLKISDGTFKAEDRQM